jgi:hypothetical protein
MQLATPKHPSDQVAALVGVTPAAIDAGQPVRLALNKADAGQAIASAAPVAKVPVPSAAPVVTKAPVMIQATVAATAPVAVAAVPPAPPPPRTTMASLASTAVAEAKTAFSSFLPHRAAPATKLRVVAVAAKRPAVRDGKSPTVVQLGAYASADRVLAAWNGAAHKYGALKAYLPMSARFASPKGTFYRLSVRGFSGVSEANALCASIKRKGGSCFVRNFAGDAPVQYASR